MPRSQQEPKTTEAAHDDGVRPASWAAVLALVAAAATVAGCGVESDGSTTYDRTQYPVGHPCRTAGACTRFVELPDGGAEALPDGGADTPADAGATTGRVRMCGPCNG